MIINIRAHQHLKYLQSIERLYSSNSPNPKNTKAILRNTDFIGPPNEISNLRPIIFAKPENETDIEKRFRLARENTQNWNENFWRNHNSKFIEERKHFRDNLKARGTNLATADEMSVFYKDFLDKNWINHLNYNISWYKKNITLLILEVRNGGINFYEYEMENKNLFDKISKDNVVYTLMKVSQTNSTSSSSLNQSTTAINETIYCEKSRNAICNSNVENKNLSHKLSANKRIIQQSIQINWNNYIRWKTLLSFGLGLWIALCITDQYLQKNTQLLRTNETPKNEEIDLINHSEDIIDYDQHHEPKWLYNFWANELPKTLVFFIFIFMIIITLDDFRLRKRITREKSRMSSNYNFTSVKPYEGECYLNELHIKSNACEKLKFIDSHNNRAVNYMNKRNHNKLYNKLGIESNVVTNIDRVSYNNDDNISFADCVNNWNLNSHIPNTDHSPTESINIKSTYDMEINKFIISMCNTSTVDEELIGDTSKLQKSIEQRKISCGEIKDNYDSKRILSVSTVRNNKNKNKNKNRNKNNRMISSSPAFKKFLYGLKNNPTTFNSTQSWNCK